MTDQRRLRVTEVRSLCPEIRQITLEPLEGTALMGFQPGSHLILHAGEHRNAYSLTGDGIMPSRYTVSVLKRNDDGGSAWLHQHLAPGSEITAEGPVSMFAPVHNQQHALLVAGGIGITPVLSHASALAALQKSAEVIYAYKPHRAAHVDQLREICHSAGFRLTEVTSAGNCRKALRDRMSDQPVGSHAYVCGPMSMLESFLEIGAAAGWPEYRLHLERFEAPELDPGEEFALRVSGSPEDLRVPVGVSILETLESAGYSVPNMCRQGVCGQCQISVRSAGSLEHRDYVLTEEEKAAGGSLMVCVSRGTDVEVAL
ncbi:oxidoreductase [Nesterenkonia sp. MY13]|uniref:Oxidoreductase n=1 Tax=Nesterenkonia sedimenti TaxID=1463632 RepID=A0A7X8YEU1_9MICC|nr:PDR/VanB family oxidoreductase [Nesterenkonia sedimenti]NLS10721.1 oxidoreductase [Nesterenkonia sedimenti]